MTEVGLIGVGKTIEARGQVAAAEHVELRYTKYAPLGEIFVINPGTMAHWFGEIEPKTVCVVVHPDMREAAQHILDYLLRDIEYTTHGEA